MASVLLVDDERNIRNGLSAMISRADSIFTDINECSNGADALKLLSERKYDLLITDLLMPQMDGMDLVASVDGLSEKPHMVILSGHDDFKYAQKAIDHGVMAYLLKPVDRNELMHVLRKAEAEISAKREEKVSRSGEAQAWESRVRSALLGDAPQEGIGAPEAAAWPGGCLVAVVNACGAYEAPGKRERNAALVPFAGRRLEAVGRKGLAFSDHRGNLVLLLGEGADLGALLGALEEATGLSLAAGVSGPGGGDLHARYLEAEYALRCRLLHPSGKVLPYAAVAGLDGKYVLPAMLLKNLSVLLDTGRREELARVVDRIFDAEELGKHRLDYAEKLSRAVKDEIIRTLSECVPHRAGFIQEQESSIRDIHCFSDIREYVRHVQGCVLNINAGLLRMKSACVPGCEIERAIRYVMDNYSKDLTMAEVANSLSLNYSYFSLLFKGKTGMNFIDYLKTLRIEKAKELLRDTDYKIHEISGMVGYGNTKHFTTTFRAFTGTSPREYRDRVYSIG